MGSDEKKKQKPCPTVKQLVLSGVLAIVIPYALIFLAGAVAERYFVIYEYTTIVLGAAALLLVILVTRFFMMMYRYRKESKAQKLAVEE